MADNKVSVSIEANTDALSVLQSSLDRLKAKLGESSQKFQEFAQQASFLEKSFQQGHTSVADFTTVLESLNASFNNAASPAKDTAKAVEEVASNAEKSNKSVGNLSKITAGATREFIVLGHEALTGDFSRIPGSLLVLGERLGGLGSILSGFTPTMLAWGGAAAAAAVATYEWAKSLEEISAAQNSVANSQFLTNQQAKNNDLQVKQNILSLRLLAGVSQEEAIKITESFAATGYISSELKQKLIGMVGDFAAATGQDAPKATEELIKLFSDPKRAADELSNSTTRLGNLLGNRFSPEQKKAITEAAEANTKFEAQKDLFNALTIVYGSADEKLTAFDKTLKAVRDLSIKDENALTVIETRQQQKSGDTGNDDRLKAAELQNQYNEQVQYGLELERQLNTVLDQRKKITLEIQALKNASNAAAATGDKELANQFINDANELNEKLLQLRTTAEKNATTIARQNAQAQVEIAKLSLKEKEGLLEAEVAQGKITRQQELDDVKQLRQQEYALDKQLSDQELALSTLTVTDRNRIEQQALVAKAKLAADEAELDNKIAEANKAEAKKASDETIQIARQNAQTTLEIQRLGFSEQRDALQASVDLGKITRSQELSQLQGIRLQEFEATRAELENEIATLNLTVAEKNRIRNQELVEYAKLNADLAKIDEEYAANQKRLTDQAAAERKKTYDDLFNKIDSAFNSSISALMRGQQTWGQALTSLLGNLEIKFVEFAAKMGLKWVETELLQTDATTAGVAARTAAEQAGNTASLAGNAAKIISQIKSDAAATYAGVFAYMSPVLGPAAAVPAGIAAGAVGAMEGLVSLDVGAWNLGADTVAQLHQGEMVVPATFADGLRQTGSISGGNSGSSQGGGDTYSITIQAIDTQTGTQFLKNNIATIVQQLSNQKRLSTP